MPTIRAYDAERDRDAIIRVWREVHWITSDEQAKWAPQFFETSRTDVAEVNGEVECQASSTDGTFRYLDEDLSMSAIVGVTTSRIAGNSVLPSGLRRTASPETPPRVWISVH